MQINLDDLLPNSRYSKLDNKAQTNSTPLQTSSKAPKREALKSVPMINNIGDENSFFNAIIHMLYFTPEILTFLQENKDNFNIENSGYSILGELYNILDKYDRLLDKEKCYLIPEEERFLDVKNLRQKISELYKGEGFFQMNNYEDPSEILYFFLNAIHSYSMSLKLPKYYIIENRKSEKDLLNENNDYDFLNEREDKCDPKCLSHTLFDIHLIQQTEWVAVFRVRLEYLVDEIERINRLKELEFVAPVDLPHVCLCCVEEDALLEGRSPVQLHFNNELATTRLLAAHVNYAVLLVGIVWNHFRGQILYRLYLLAGVKRQQCIEEAYDEILVLAKNLLEGHIRLWVKVFCHVVCPRSPFKGIVPLSKNMRMLSHWRGEYKRAATFQKAENDKMPRFPMWLLCL